jgi:hypothetical protein
MKRFLISLGVGFVAALCGSLEQTWPIYLDFVAHQPGRVPTSQADAFPPSNAFFMASPLWIPFWFVITGVVWTVWTILKTDKGNSQVPVRLLIFYLLCIASIPTLVVMSDFDNNEATEEEWNWVIGWSYLVIGPALAALYLAIRNFRYMPAVAVFAALFALFHVGTTIADYGLIPRYIPDIRFGFDESSGRVDLDFVSYLRFSLILAVPFLIVYFLWRFWPGRGAFVVRPAS